jgi:Asp/Glu/hydantoin racemase
MVRTLAEAFPMPVLKIDDPMAQRAVQTGSRIGVAVTFAPTQEPTRRLLTEAAAAAQRKVDLDIEMIPGAYDALLTNDFETHDRLLIEACERLASRHPDALVLAQVSMARAEDRIRQRVGIPVYSSLSTSLEALRKLLP